MRGPLRRWRNLAAGLAVAGFVPFAAAAPPVTSGAGAAPSLDGPAWLTRINGAAGGLNYRGTMVFTADNGVVSSSKVAHLCVGEEVYERLQALDGQLHRVYRHNETVRTVWPLRRLVVVEPKAVAPGLVSTRRRVEPRALRHYTLKVLGTSHVAGRTARQLLLEPTDELRFVQRLWADEASGLLLRADVVGADGRVLESSAFTEVEVGGPGSPKELLEGMAPPAYEVLPSQREAVDWAAQGWALREPVPGFELQGCVRRPAPSAPGRAEMHALQAVFSDGMSYVSIFIEPYGEQRHPQALAAGFGAMHTVMQRVGDHWITAIGEVPRRTLERFIGALERRVPAAGPAASSAAGSAAAPAAPPR
ncbi:MAG: MucB/RseB C-terminal domain-containing protein [Rubrivivax sp.]